MRFYLCLLFLVVSALLHAQQLNLEACLAYAEQNNLDINHQNFQVELQKNALRTAELRKYPSVSANFSQGLILGRNIDPFSNQLVLEDISTSSYGASADLVLFNGFAIKNQITENHKLLSAVENDVKQFRFDLKIDIIMAYMQVLLNAELEQIAKDQKNDLERQLERTKQLIEEGVSATVTLSDIEAQLASADFDVISASTAKRSSLLALAQLINWRESRELEIERINVTEISPMQRLANVSFPSLQAVKFRREGAQYALHAAKGFRFPSVSLGVGFNTSFSSIAPEEYHYMRQLGYNLGQFTRLSVNFPIFTRGEANSAISIAKTNLKILENEYQNTSYKLNQRVQKAYLEYTNAVEKQKSATIKLAAQEKAFESAQARYEEGVLHFIEFNTFRTNLQQAKSNHALATYELYFQAKVLQAYEEL